MAKTIGNDILLSESMVSPDYKVDFAIGTTYSLDLEYLLSITIYLGLLGELDEILQKSPHYLLNAVLESRDKFMVFCNASNVGYDSVKVPKSATKLYSLLENSIKPLCLSKNAKNIINFHPKIWVIKETSTFDNSAQIKLIVSSRNMTQSTSLDIVSTLTGKIQNKPQNRKKIKPLWEFLEWLKANSKCDKNQLYKIDCLIADLKKVSDFDLTLDSLQSNSDIFEDYQFLPIGIDSEKNKDNIGENCFKGLSESRDILILSPFIKEETLSNFFNYKGKKTLITRKEWLTQSIFDEFNQSDGVYIVKDILLDSKDSPTDIHAKMYFSNCNGKNYLYLGSANATENGFKRNVEFLLKLTYKPYIASHSTLKNDLIFDADDCLFEKLENFDETKIANVITDDSAIRNAIILLQKSKAIVCPKDDTWTINITTKTIDSNIKICPLQRLDLVQELRNENHFEGLKIEELTEFYLVEVDNFRRIVKISTKGIPLIERDNAIKNSIIDTPAKFLDYLGYMLSESPESYAAENAGLKKSLTNLSSQENLCDIGNNLYEELLRLTYIDPRRVKMIREKIDGLQENVIPKGFLEFYSAFEKIAKKNLAKLHSHE